MKKKYTVIRVRSFRQECSLKRFKDFKSAWKWVEKDRTKERERFQSKGITEERPDDVDKKHRYSCLFWGCGDLTEWYVAVKK